MTTNEFQSASGRSEGGVRIRLAREGELGQLMDIDDDACSLFDSVGMRLSLPREHPFVVADAERWGRSVLAGRAFVAVDTGDALVGFAALEEPDGAPYLDQLSVVSRMMRRGVGRALLAAAIDWSGARPLWLTTYAHIPWNAPFYERYGFVRVPESRLGPELTRIIAEQREALPEPEQRIAMVRRGGSSTD